MVDSPFALTIPPLGFQILVPNCFPGDPYISVANANTAAIDIDPHRTTSMDVGGLIRSVPDELTTVCPGKERSPLDILVKQYVDGLKTTIYVRGVDTPSLGTPGWMGDFLKDITVPLPFTGHALDSLIKNYTMSDVHFSLPNPFAEPGTPDAQLTVSALVKVLVGVPKQMNFRLDIPQVRANAAVSYKGSQLGVLDLPEWQAANSTLIEDEDGSPALFVQFPMENAPIKVTDEDVLSKVLQTVVFQGRPVQLHVDAAVDAKVATGLGQLAIRGVPAEGKMHVKRKCN